MKLISTLLLTGACGLSAVGQTTIANGDYELWGGNPTPGVTAEPNGWYSNKSGSTIAKLGPQTCFQENTIVHSGSASAKVVTENYIGTKVNGVVTTAVVNAVSTDKSTGYIGTINRDNPSDVRRRAFTGRPDSLVGWYQYTQGSPSGASEQGKVRAILHTSDYFDPETPVSGNHPDLSANKIGDALFLTPMSNVGSWTRFSIPFTYVSASTPAYIMINVTSSADQLTTVGGSTIYVDDLEVVYTPPSNLTATSITSNSAVISWTESAIGSAGSEYVISTTPGAPSGSGTVTSALTYTATGLTPATTYYASVRDTGISSAFSAWVTIPFTTLGTSGVGSITNNNFAVTAYPNPVNDVLTISIEGCNGKTGQVQLMDISGSVISTTDVNAATVNISVKGMAPCMYVARYIDSEHTQTIKINKQ